MNAPRRSFAAYEAEVERENERERLALAAFYAREKHYKVRWIQWLIDRWHWLRWFSWH
jgi:hypothetical protein